MSQTPQHLPFRVPRAARMLALACALLHAVPAQGQLRSPIVSEPAGPVHPPAWVGRTVSPPTLPPAASTSIGTLVADGLVVSVVSAASGALAGFLLADMVETNELIGAMWGFSLLPAVTVPLVVHDENRRRGRMGWVLAGGLSVAAATMSIVYQSESGRNAALVLFGSPLAQVISAVAIERATQRR